MDVKPGLRIAVVGSGISGLSAAWLLSQKHDVTLFEQSSRPGGHSNTVDAPGPNGPIPVDTGFIVYNERTYPNLIAMFDHLGVATQESNMSFAISLDGGKFEYAGNNIGSLFAQKRNAVSPRFWSMLSDLLRFYREAPSDIAALDDSVTLGDYLQSRNYGRAFQEDHLLPMASAVWSATPQTLMSYPARAFIRFNDNHGLLQISNRPAWRTVTGGSRNYVSRLLDASRAKLSLNTQIAFIVRNGHDIVVHDVKGNTATFDHVVMACHTDQALSLLEAPSVAEYEVLSKIRYGKNRAILHTDTSLMPRRKNVWSSWNYIGNRNDVRACPTITYWMNLLQDIPQSSPLFVTLNPLHEPKPESIIHSEIYHHPIFDPGAMNAQKRAWLLQGHKNTWYCGAWMGSGFHEDGLQAGLAVAEALGGVRRPWTVANESGRLSLPTVLSPVQEQVA